MEKKVSKLWVRGKCDKCGKATFVRTWNRVARLCEACIKIADKEHLE